LARTFWEAAAESRFLLQQCMACLRYQFYPRPLCLNCRRAQLRSVGASGRGSVYSVTTVRVDLTGASPTLPYQVALVDLAEGPRVLARILGPDVRVGDAVELCWVKPADGQHDYAFRAAGAGSSQ